MAADKVLTEIFNRHLPYEIDRLRRTYEMIEALARSPISPESAYQEAQRFALIESFCVHSRSLTDFFSGHRGGPSDAIAEDFTVGFTTALKAKEEPLFNIRTKLNKQVFHLTKNRLDAEAD
jgi:hypothetical protein